NEITGNAPHHHRDAPAIAEIGIEAVAELERAGLRHLGDEKAPVAVDRLHLAGQRRRRGLRLGLRRWRWRERDLRRRGRLNDRRRVHFGRWRLGHRRPRRLLLRRALRLLRGGRLRVLHGGWRRRRAYHRDRRRGQRYFATPVKRGQHTGDDHGDGRGRRACDDQFPALPARRGNAHCRLRRLHPDRGVGVGDDGAGGQRLAFEREAYPFSEVTRALQSVVRFLGERALDDRVPGVRERRVERRGLDRLLAQHLLHDGGRRAGERPVAGQELVEHHAGGKDVAPRVHRYAEELLG